MKSGPHDLHLPEAGVRDTLKTQEAGTSAVPRIHFIVGISPGRV